LTIVRPISLGRAAGPIELVRARALSPSRPLAADKSEIMTKSKRSGNRPSARTTAGSILLCVSLVFVVAGLTAIPALVRRYAFGGSLVEACRQENWVQARRLLEAGTDPNAADDRGRTALMWAARSAPPDVVDLLLLKGANPRHKSANYGDTAIDYAMNRADDSAKRHIMSLLVRVESGAPHQSQRRAERSASGQP
jgi:hypothetical protein